MKSLVQFINECLIIESGNAIEGATPIPAYITPLVYQEIEEKVKKHNSKIQMCPLGSIGKKRDDQFNGDIDIAIVIKDRPALVELLKEIFPDCQLCERTTNDISSIGYKWNLEGKSGIAQVDFMVTKDINWAAWRWSSPDFKKGESKYKGQAKDWMLRAITHAIPSKEPIEYFEDGKTIKRKWRVVFNFEGVFNVLINHIGKKSNYVKSENKELMQLATNDPQNVMKFCLGEKAEAEDFVKGAEHLWKRAHEIWPWGDEALEDFERDWYENYMNYEGGKNKGTIKFDAKDFPCKFYIKQLKKDATL